ncbi:aspartate aminotransferase family protein [Sinorhizobium numidicum]|uniref:Aspartate aminotransferase family protein n=1 Tax=Sinorhizobium numidicum TaxID=680248 RepID=A0ABY8CSY5_9HYPH|nr:aspartate aminotransferase family protein [Sinorhizobium numidicum]WEX75267.1 aspartate aminotransferase family protein [Sinorhizobium numidicum]WEX81262.1 aspartate aminotransferase family protein [Sinorhizobium numidicum]
MFTVAGVETSENIGTGLPLLSLDQSLDLENTAANRLYSQHLNKYMLQIFDILGLKDMDIKGAQGLEIWLSDGRTLLDFSAGLGVVGLGHNHPRIIEAERKCHERKVIDCIKIAPHKLQGALAYNLSLFLPPPLTVSFLAVSGAEANEAAMKLSERVQTPKGKNKFLCMRGAFHGKTHGPLSLTTATDVQSGFLLGVPKENVVYVSYGDIETMRQAINAETDSSGRNSIIAAIVETIHGTTCELPPAGYLSQFAELCRKNDILSIFDEVKVGMGRSGRFCAFQYEDATPDIVTLAKTLGGGKREVAVMVTSQALFDRAYGNKQDCNLHSSSFSGLGESCAVAIETLNIIQDEGLIENAEKNGQYLSKRLHELKSKYPKQILDVRGRGLFQAIRLNFHQELVSKLVDISKNPLFQTYQTVLIGAVTRQLFERHNILVHFQPGARDILHFMPPFVAQQHHIDKLIAALDDTLSSGIADATLRFVTQNIARVFRDMT